MADFPALPLWTDAWIADTVHLGRAERGLYLDLLIIMWRTPGCSVPNDIDWLKKHLVLGDQCLPQLKSLIKEFFHFDANATVVAYPRNVPLASERLYQKRLYREWSYLHRQSKRQSKNAKSRWEKENNSSHFDATTTEVAYAPTPTPTPTPLLDNNLTVVRHRDDDVCDLAFAAFNEMAGRIGLPKALKLTPARKAKLRARLNGHGLPLWVGALGKIEASPFLRGDSKGGWRAGLDFLLQESSFNKLVEGSYDRTAGKDVGSGNMDVTKKIKETPWDQRVKMFRKDGTWRNEWGFAPGERGCSVPNELLQPQEIAAKEGRVIA